MLMALRSMAQNLSDVPGRKSLILFTSGFPLGNEARSEANAAIDSCNKANVAVYPIDVRGLSAGAPGMGVDDSSTPGRRGRAALEFPPVFPGVALRASGIALAASPVLRIASFMMAAPEWEPQARGGGTTGTPAGGGAGGNTGSPGGGISRGGSAGSTGGNASGNGDGKRDDACSQHRQHGSEPEQQRHPQQQ